jgi:hypothetical protein
MDGYCLTVYYLKKMFDKLCYGVTFLKIARSDLCKWDLRLKPIFDTVPAASKFDA